MLKISVCSENCKKACWKFQHVLKTVMHVVCLKFQCIKTMLNISGCVENMLKISRHVENYNMCRKLCWNSMLKISHVLNTVTLAESHVKTSRRVENVYVRHVENHIENHVEVRKKDHHTLRHVSKLSGRFRFSPSVCTSYWSETYLSIKNPKASRARLRPQLQIACFATSATFGLKSWAPPLTKSWIRTCRNHCYHPQTKFGER